MSAPYMPWYIGDYLKDTRHLNTEQHGAYLLLLGIMWTSGGTLPADEKKLARIAGLPPQKWAKYRDDLMAFFVVDGAVIRQSRIEKEIKKAEVVSQKRSQAGKRGAEANALKNKSAPTANATANAQQTASIARASTNPDTYIPIGISDAARPEDDDPKRAFWRECTAELRGLFPDKSEPACKALLGKFLQAAQNDAERVMAEVRNCAFHQPADPVSWIMGRLRQAPKARGSPSGQTSMLSAIDEVRREIRR